MRGESDDFWHWPPYEGLIKLFISDPNLPPDCDYYTNGFGRWPGTEASGDAFVMFPSIYHRSGDYLDTEIYSSRNGIQWFRSHQNPITFPKNCHLLPQGAMYFGNGIWEDPSTQRWAKFTPNYSRNHNDPVLLGNIGGLHKALFRPDGFMGLTGDAGGEFWTIQFQSRSPTIQINAVTMNAGFIKFGLYDNWCHGEIGEFTVDDCDPLVGDMLWKTVSWKGESDISDFDDAYLRLHIILKHATIYAIRFF